MDPPDNGSAPPDRERSRKDSQFSYHSRESQVSSCARDVFPGLLKGRHENSKEKEVRRKRSTRNSDTRPVRFEALEELTHGDVVEQLKNGISRIDALDFEDEIRDEAA